MSEHLSYEIYGPEYSLPKWIKNIYFGKCKTKPHVNHDLWYVVISQGVQPPAKMEFLEPTVDTAVFVATQYATPKYFEMWKRDTSKWREIAHSVLEGSFCYTYETTWDNIPVFDHRLNNARLVKYGYARTQVENREIWFIALHGKSAFLVDRYCANPKFLERMGDDELKWEIICRTKLLEGNEYEWGAIGSYSTTEQHNDYLRSHDGYAADSPFWTFKPDKIEKRISAYEDIVGNLIRKESKVDWDRLSSGEKAKRIENFTRQRIFDIFES